MNPNLEFKHSRTLNTLAYAVDSNQILLRVINMMDHFDGDQAIVQHFDVNAWAREYYIEANEHLVPLNGNSSDLLAGVFLNITEMNLSGTMAKDKLDNGISKLTKWKTPKDQNPVNPPRKPNDMLVQVEVPNTGANSLYGAQGNSTSLMEDNYMVSLEPQRIRVFLINYNVPPQLGSRLEQRLNQQQQTPTK